MVADSRILIRISSLSFMQRGIEAVDIIAPLATVYDYGIEQSVPRKETSQRINLPRTPGF